MSATRPLALASVLAFSAAATMGALGVGFLLHTDFEPQVLGKYSFGYFLFLLAWWLLLTPAVFLLVRWVFRTQVLTLPSSRTLTWRPTAKLLLVLIVGWLFAQAVEARVHKALGRGVATPLLTDSFHPYLQNTPRPGRARLGVNWQGFRGPEVSSAKPEGVYRIFVLGGSTVFCAALPLEQSHPELLRDLLQRKHEDLEIQVQNAGAEWHCSAHSLIKYLTRIRSFDPDMIVVYHGINDLYRSFSPEAFAVGPYRSDYSHFHGAVANLVRPESTTWQLVRMRLGYWCSDLRYDRVRVAGPDGDGVKGIRQMFFPRSRAIEIESWRSLGAFERNMGDLIDAALGHAVQVVVASQPSLYRDGLDEEDRELLWFPLAHQENGTHASIGSMADGMRQVNAISRRIAEEAGVLFVDLDAAVPKDTDHLYDDVHVTARGAACIADALAREIENAGLIRAH